VSSKARRGGSQRERETKRKSAKERGRENKRSGERERVRASERDIDALAHASSTHERTNAYAQAPNESAVLKTAVAETSAKRRLGELNVRSARLLFFRIAREAPSRGNIRGDYHNDYCIR
jgi:hypothetical protein